MKSIIHMLSIAVWLCFSAAALQADVSLPNIFSDHMVLQRNQSNPVWGKAAPGEKVTVSIAGQKHKAVANAQGNWRIELDPMKACCAPLTLAVKGKNKIELEDVLVGEVWMCSGQSNMGWRVNGSNHKDLEMASANYPEIRLITAPRNGSETPQFNLDDQWKRCTPETVGDFSATGYFFGRRIHNTLRVPVGLINTAWGGSRIESFMPRSTLEKDGSYDEFLKDWDRRIEKDADREFAENSAKYKAWVAAGSKGYMGEPIHARVANHAPGSIYNGLIHPVVGYGMKGAIWCQGESNADRAEQYRRLFPLLITTWRDLWGQGDFSFYWVQLADFSNEVKQPTGGPWAELREAQTMTLSLPHTGEAIVLDIGQSRFIHPGDKQTVASRLARHALAKDYGFKMASDSPRFKSMVINGNVATITFDKVDTTLYAFDVPEVKGFAIAGKDRKFVWADAKIVGKNKVEVSSDQIAEPVAVRYGFEINPVVNLTDKIGLPVTPFRTDDWPGKTAGKETAGKL